jgi:hypothetical protein
MLPFAGVVFSFNVSDRFHLDVEAKNFTHLFSVRPSQTLRHVGKYRVFGEGPSTLGHQDFLDILALRTLVGCGIERHPPTTILVSSGRVSHRRAD